jgi:hypothetical protein
MENKQWDWNYAIIAHKDTLSLTQNTQLKMMYQAKRHEMSRLWQILFF